MLQQLSLPGCFWKTVQLISKQRRVGRCYHMLVIKRMLISSIILTGIPFVVRGATFAPICRGQKDVSCPYCGARFVLPLKGSSVLSVSLQWFE